MSSLLESPYSLQVNTPKMTRRDQNGNFIRMHRDSSLPPPIRKTRITSESPSLIQPCPPPRKHVSISQSDLQGHNSSSSSYNTGNRIYSNHQHEVDSNIDRNLPVRTSYRPNSRYSHLILNSSHQTRTSQSHYDGSLPCHYASQRANVNQTSSVGKDANSNFYCRNLHQGQTLPIKKSPYPNYAFHIPPQNYNRYGSRSSSASYDRFGSSAFDRAYLIPASQPTPDIVTTAERQQSVYAREIPRKIMLSEGNLLTAHIETIRDDGRDNPFKPGTELSWEADLIVRLYKRGHPLSEVPILLEKIKKQLEQKKNIDLGAAIPNERPDLTQNEVNNNSNNEAASIILVNKSKTVSNDLCNITNANLSKVDISNSEKDNGLKLPIDDELIDSIISILDRKADCDNKVDSLVEDNHINDTNIRPEKERKSSEIAGKLAPAMVSIPGRNIKKDNKIIDNEINETKIKQPSPKLDPANKKKFSKLKTKKNRPIGKNNINKTESNLPLDDTDDDHHGGQEVDIKRFNCCSIQ